MAKESAAAKKKRLEAEAAAKAAPRDLLAEAVNARISNAPLMATEAEMDALLKDPRGPLVEFNVNMRSGDKLAFRATELGVQVKQAGGASQAAPPQAAWATPPATPVAPIPPAPPAPGAAAPPAPAAPGAKTFTFADGVPMPAPRRGGRGSTVYGFEQMDVGRSFFIPATDDNPNPAKRIASTVSSASSRLEPKKFIVRSIVTDEATGRAWNVPPGTKGAGVWRTA